MKLLRLASLFATIFLAPVSQLHADGNPKEWMEEFIQGNYVLLGKAIDSGQAYLGEVSIRRVAPGLQVTRIVAGVTVVGSASIESATADRVQVLRIRFVEAGQRFEETCLVGSDLDNHARITCYLYMPGVRAMKPGMEAMFINPDKP